MTVAKTNDVGGKSRPMKLSAAEICWAVGRTRFQMIRKCSCKRIMTGRICPTGSAYVIETMGGPVTLAPSGILTDDLDTDDLEFQHHFHLGGRNKFIWGLGYRFTHEVD